jgi:hypothetical protein
MVRQCVNSKIFGAFVSGWVLSVFWLISPVQAAIIPFEFNGTSSTPGVTVHATMGLDSSVVVPNGTFTLANVSSFAVQYTGTFSASGSSLPASLSGQMSSGPTPVFSSLFVNDSLTVPGHSGTNNFQFYGLNGQSWSFAVTGPTPGPVQIVGTGTWTPAPVPLPGAAILFFSGLAGLAALKRRRQGHVSKQFEQSASFRA